MLTVSNRPHEEPHRMLTWEKTWKRSLFKRGWTISAIARHLGRDRKTVRAYVAGRTDARRPATGRPRPARAVRRLPRGPLRRRPAPLGDRALRRGRPLGYPRGYPSFARGLRRAGLRPHCEACAGVRGRATIEIGHPPGEEIQWDWFELPAPWGGTAHVLMGTCRTRDDARGLRRQRGPAALVDGIDAGLRRLGGTARRWRTDRLDGDRAGHGHVLASFAPVAKH